MCKKYKFHLWINRETGENPVRSRHCIREFHSNRSLEKSGKALWSNDLKSGELLVWIYKMILTVDEKHLEFFIVL